MKNRNLWMRYHGTTWSSYIRNIGLIASPSCEILIKAVVWKIIIFCYLFFAYGQRGGTEKEKDTPNLICDSNFVASYLRSRAPGFLPLNGPQSPCTKTIRVWAYSNPASFWSALLASHCPTMQLFPSLSFTPPKLYLASEPVTPTISPYKSYNWLNY